MGRMGRSVAFASGGAAQLRVNTLRGGGLEPGERTAAGDQPGWPTMPLARGQAPLGGSRLRRRPAEQAWGHQPPIMAIMRSSAVPKVDSGRTLHALTSRPATSPPRGSNVRQPPPLSTLSDRFDSGAGWRLATRRSGRAPCNFGNAEDARPLPPPAIVSSGSRVASLGMPVDVGAHALKASVRAHHAAASRLAEDQSPTVGLLLFYAAECGLKAALLQRQALRDTASIPADLRSHDLRRIMKELRLPPAMDLLGAYRSVSPGGGVDSIAPSELHEAWRYGKKIKPEDHDAALASLRQILSWCEQEKCG